PKLFNAFSMCGSTSLPSYTASSLPTTSTPSRDIASTVQETDRLRLSSARLANESERLLGELPDAEIVERPGRAGEHLLFGLQLCSTRRRPTNITQRAASTRRSSRFQTIRRASVGVAGPPRTSRRRVQPRPAVDEIAGLPGCGTARRTDPPERRAAPHAEARRGDVYGLAV